MRHLSKSGIVQIGALGGVIGSRTANVSEENINETKFIAFYMGKKIDVEGKDLWDAKQKAITQLKVPKAKVGYLAVVSAESQKNQDFRFESVNEVKAGDILKHKHNPNIEIELIAPTNRGWKVYQIEKGKKKIAHFDKQDISGNKSLFESVNKATINEIEYKDAMEDFNAELAKNPQVAAIAKYHNRSIKDTVRALQMRIRNARYYDKSVKEVSIDFTDTISKEHVKLSKKYPHANPKYKNYASESVNEGIENVANGLPQTMGTSKSLKRETLKSIVREVMQEEAEYQKFFQKVLDKAGKSIPSMSDDEKKAFFNKVDAAWKAKQEALVGNQHKLDVDGDGDIGADDLADLRAGKKVNEAETEIKVGDMIKVVDNPHWEAALGKKGPFKRKVKGIHGDNVFFTDGSNSSMKYVKK